MTRRDGGRGFTLIELLVVIAIIGVLASISLIAMVTYRERAQASRVAQEVANFQKAAAVYYADNQRYPDPESAILEAGGQISDYCAGAINVEGEIVAQKCCVSQGGCMYNAEEFDTLPAEGNFAVAPRAPRWLTYLGQTAHAIFNGSMPSFLTEAPAVSGYKGVFYECANAGCTNAFVYFSVSPTLDSCTRGVAHGEEFFGVCAQDITGSNVDGSSSGGDVENCANGIDDDGDSLIDCADEEDCSSHQSCTLTEDCDDTVDNDGDDLVDCADDDCSGDPACAPSEDCTDGVDNDGDAMTDCSDSDCDAATNCCNVCDDMGSCYDACACNGDPYCGESNCSDAIDNDEDNDYDCGDSDCNGDPACTPTEDCTDNVDNDLDGDVDCDDADCAIDPACAPPEDCSTSQDEDGDGSGQCGDTDCSSWESSYSWTSEIYYTYQYCSAGSLQNGSGSGSCSDWSDNDSDGCTDGGDVDCGGGENCTNGFDDNCDGNADCSDSGCQYSGSPCDAYNCSCGVAYNCSCGDPYNCDCGNGVFSCSCGDPYNCSCGDAYNCSCY